MDLSGLKFSVLETYTVTCLHKHLLLHLLFYTVF